MVRGDPAPRRGDDAHRWPISAAWRSSSSRSSATPSRRPWRLRNIVDEVYKLGVLSLLIICVCGLAVGMVLALQGYNTLERFGATQALGAVVGLSLVRELGPVLTALLVTGRAGSATAAEIGTMVATEQLDGLRMMSVDPVDYVVTPRAVAMIFVMPLLAALFIVCGIFGGWLVGVRLLGVDSGAYMTSLETSVDLRDDLGGSFLKASVFGVLVGLDRDLPRLHQRADVGGRERRHHGDRRRGVRERPHLRLLHHGAVGGVR